MAVESIGTPVQIRNITRNHLFVAARKMPLREMDGVAHFDDATQKVRPRSEALDNARNLLPPRPGSPEVISRSRFSSGFSILDDSDFRRRLYWGAV